MKYYVTITIYLITSLYACKTKKIKVESNIYNSQMEIQTKRYPITVFEGNLKDINSSEAIPFAEVKLRDRDGINRDKITDKAGNFLIKDLPLGDFKLFITADGYQKITYDFSFNEHTYYNCEIKLKKIKPEKPIKTN
jgi:hypothetical protein